MTGACSLALIGPSGLGKTHLAIALGTKMVQLGYSVRFLLAQQLANAVVSASSRSEITRLIDPLIRCDRLILDEFGFLTVEPQVGPVLYEIIAARYEKGATILTSNKSLATWGELVGDTALMMAILDRMLASRRGVLFTRQLVSPARERAGHRDDQIGGIPVSGEGLTSCWMLDFTPQSCLLDSCELH